MNTRVTRRMIRCLLGKQAPLALCALLVLAFAVTADAGVDRYGGVWHEGQATGPFVPLTTGMSYNDVQTYRSAWEDYRLTDLELVVQGCPAESTDLFASQWEEGSWNDILEFYTTLSDFENELGNRCDEGFKLIDFEVWDSVCREAGLRYVALYSDENGCEAEPGPAIHGSKPEDFQSVVFSENGAGYELVDFEPTESYNPSSILGVFYAGSTSQRFVIFDRPTFEQDMLNADGYRVLDDMESYLDTPEWPRGASPTRRVAGLWNGSSQRDDHEVGEVYSKFEQLLFKDWSTRRLADFEVYPNTFDRRFHDVFSSHLGSLPVGWGVSVRQLGEDVGSTGGGLATRPDAAQNLNPDPMSHNTQGVTASVTKLITAVGVMAYADTQNQPNLPDWLDQRLVDILPFDFFNFGNGVNQITVRDVLTQRTGLSNFSPTTNPLTDPAGYRAETVAWLQMPVASSLPAPFNYQNAHFDILALSMAELVAPQYPTSADPWRAWMNDNVMAKVGIGNRRCGWQSGHARSYPVHWSTEYQTWLPFSHQCDGDGTGASMWYLSPDDMARLAHGVRTSILVSPTYTQEFFDQGLGLDHFFGPSLAYQPAWDSTFGTYGEEIHSKNGGLSQSVNGDLTGTETLVAFFDDYNFDDDLYNLNEYSYELGGTGFDIGIAVHSSSIHTNDPCLLPQTPMCTGNDRLFPSPWSMIVEAMRQPEAW